MSDLSIRDIITKISAGNIRIPSFQRKFVWDADSVAFLMDSIFKGYPFGTIQLWRTKEQLKTERRIGPFDLFERDADYPIDYVLDGQQRITSIFGVFQNDHPINSEETNPFNIYFDYSANPDIQESQFYALSADSENEKNKYFPLNCLFDTIKYREATKNLPDQVLTKIDDLQARFKEAKIPIQTLETDDKTIVAIVFERINRKGVPLDTFQLLSAWTWSEDFALQDKFEDLTDELKPYGFDEIGANINLLLRVFASILNGNASSKSLMTINGATVRDRFDEILNGIRGAIDFLKRNLYIQKIENLPYENILVPLSVFFSNEGNDHYYYDDKQRRTIEEWFWRTCFSKRYSAGILNALNRDIDEIKKLKSHKPSNLSSISTNITKEYFTENQFLMGSVVTNTFILLLAHQHPKSFITGSNIILAEALKEYNRNEFHHIYPKSYLKTHVHTNKDNCLANFCFLSRADNKKIGGEAPSLYKKHLIGNLSEILKSAIINEDVLFKDDFDSFVEDRSEQLVLKAAELVNK